ncbi:MAG: hypothetical protein ACM3UX_00205 [Candidatus Woesearchaeota archaeon]
MTLTQLRSFVRDAVMEKSTDLGLIPDDTSLDRYAHAAHKAIYEQAVEWNPRPWMVRSADLTYANPLTFTTIAGGGKPVRSVHLVRVKNGVGYSPVTPQEAGYIDFADFEDGATSVQVPESCRWYVEGAGLYLTPPPTGATLSVSFVRHVGEIASGDEILGGLLLDHHDLVGFKAAQLIYRKDEMLRTPWDEEIAEKLRALRSALARNQGQRTRRIRRSSTFPNTRRR